MPFIPNTRKIAVKFFQGTADGCLVDYPQVQVIRPLPSDSDVGF